jgi:hypothetical protein
MMPQPFYPAIEIYAMAAGIMDIPGSTSELTMFRIKLMRATIAEGKREGLSEQEIRERCMFGVNTPQC